MPQVKPSFETFARIKVVGVGGGGCKAIQRMMASKIHGVDFVAINLDAQDLNNSNAPTKILLGRNLTRGLGAGMNPEVGRQGASDSSEEIADALKNSEMVFITAGLGGGTGSGAAPIVAEIARDSGALTVGVVTKPFSFEGAARSRIADEAWAILKDKVDALITIPNDRLLSIIDRKTPLLEAFAKVDDVLRQGVQGISDLITIPGIVNLDFSDVKTIMSNSGSALMGIGYASGEDRAIEAARMAINSPLLDIAIDGARGVLLSVAGGMDMALSEISDATGIVREKIDPSAKIIFGAVIDEKLKKGEIKITVIATGFVSNAQKVPQYQAPISMFDEIPQIPHSNGFHSSMGSATPMSSPTHTQSQSVHQMPQAQTSPYGSRPPQNQPSYNPQPTYTQPTYTQPTYNQPSQPPAKITNEVIDDLAQADDGEFDIPAFIRRKMKS